MALQPDDVESKEFATQWRGYDQKEVDRFLDLVASSMAELARERDELARRVEETERDASDTLGAEQLFKRALVDAQRTADETVAGARRTAEEILTEARRDAEAHRERARAQVGGIREAVEELHRFRSEYRERVREVVQRVGELPPLPPALDQLVERTRSVALPREDAAANHDPVTAEKDPAPDAEDGRPDAAAGDRRPDDPAPPWR